MTITSNTSTITVSTGIVPGHKLYLDATEISFIRDKINNNQNPWKDAYTDLLNTDVNEALDTVSYPTVYDITNKHLFYDNNTAKTGDYNAAIKLGRCVRALGLAYALTGTTSYANKAINFIKAWCFDNNTYMLPSIKSGSNQIFIYVTIPGMLYGADLIWNYSNFQSATVTYHKTDGTTQSLSLPNAIKAWSNDLSTSLWTLDNSVGPTTQNYANWRVAFHMACATINNDTTKMSGLCQRFKDLIPYQIETNGRMKNEYTRGDGSLTCGSVTYTGSGLSYSLYAINAMTQAAEIVRHHPEINQNLYTYKDSRNIGLEKALDFYAPYCYDSNMPQKWRSDGYKQRGCEYICICSSGRCHKGNMGLWEVVNKYYQKSSYKSVITTRGRPMYEERNTGPTTLTHAR